MCYLNSPIKKQLGLRANTPEAVGEDLVFWAGLGDIGRHCLQRTKHTEICPYVILFADWMYLSGASLHVRPYRLYISQEG